MAITTNAELITAVENYLARSDLTARIPEFIALCEAKMNRHLKCRQMEQRSTTTCDTSDDEPEFVSLPTDFQTMRRIRLTGVTGKPRVEYLTGTQIDEYRNGLDNVAGTPRYYTIIGDEIEFLPTPDDDYVVEMVYRKNIPPIAENSTNWLLTLAPDAYLYGTLLEATPFIKEDERIATWVGGFKSAIDGLNQLSIDAQYSGPMQIRLSTASP